MTEALSSRDTPRDPQADQLRAAIVRAFHSRGDRDVTDELRGAVCDYVRERRSAGVRAEEVVIAVKRVIDLAELHPIRTIERRALTERIVTWCIGEYYRAD
jgi:hypothetical protein